MSIERSARLWQWCYWLRFCYATNNAYLTIALIYCLLMGCVTKKNLSRKIVLNQAKALYFDGKDKWLIFENIMFFGV